MTLSVEVGPGQPAGIVVRLAGEERLQGMEVDDHDLGAGEGLRGERLLVDAVVRNDNPQTDRVAARLRLRGGEEDGEWRLQADLEEGALGRFSFTITFV
ncbi:MAG: hypothetical protein ACI8RZ_002183 [Myxococcota bacterium]